MTTTKRPIALDRFRRNLRATWLATGLSHAELAKRAGVHKVTLSRILNGHLTPTVSTAERLANAAGMSLEKSFAKGRN